MECTSRVVTGIRNLERTWWVVNCVWIYLPVPYPCPTAALQRTRFYSNLEAASRHYSAVRLYNKGASFGPKYLIMSPLNQYLEIFGQKIFDNSYV